MKTDWKNGDTLTPKVLNDAAKDINDAIALANAASAQVTNKIDAAIKEISSISTKKWSSFSVGGDEDKFYLVTLGVLNDEVITIKRHVNWDKPWKGHYYLRALFDTWGYGCYANIAEIIKEGGKKFRHGVINSNGGEQV